MILNKNSIKLFANVRSFLKLNFRKWIIFIYLLSLFGCFDGRIIYHYVYSFVHPFYKGKDGSNSFLEIELSEFSESLKTKNNISYPFRFLTVANYGNYNYLIFRLSPVDRSQEKFLLFHQSYDFEHIDYNLKIGCKYLFFLPTGSLGMKVSIPERYTNNRQIEIDSIKIQKFVKNDQKLILKINPNDFTQYEISIIDSSSSEKNNLISSECKSI